MGSIMICVDKETGALSIDTHGIEEDRALEIIREIGVDAISHFTLPEREGPSDGPANVHRHHHHDHDHHHDHQQQGVD